MDTENEYRRFAYLAAKRGAVRPADYAHIPDIQNALVTSGAVIAYLTGGAAIGGAAAKGATAVIL